MMSLKEACLSPNSNYAYIKDITGGKDHSQEGKQVGWYPCLRTASFRISTN